MIKMIMVDKDEDIYELTGISDYHTLYEIGFDLDDWDVGFCCDEKLHIEHTDEDDGSIYYEWLPPAYWLGQQMEHYCVGYNYCEYNGKHYYTVHHA